MRPRMDFHLVLHGESLWPINYKNAFIYFNSAFLVSGEHLVLLHFFNDTCLIFCQFLNIIFYLISPNLSWNSERTQYGLFWYYFGLYKHAHNVLNKILR